ncbi:hypothetical protein NQ314_016623 [Rhamnusium bicolor]|uniref:Uncharacterized protein n=1 Tax=Rhamnusium bicolor TaxID=1586634 RepID=A0AAV8WWJ3_9CUCU|nr:hypothetical protein NQ314_016623 [Rhamnusium bicolor]
MCILFTHVDPNPNEGDYRLIVATNRDEFYRRPALDARRCDEAELFVIGGKDMEPGREGGMWFGFSTKEMKDGKRKKHCIATLLNITGEKAVHADVTVELSKDEANTFHHSNTPTIDSVYSGKQTLAFGNSPTYSPLRKVMEGRNKFEEIINRDLHNDELVEELLKLLKDKSSHLPDPELEKRAPVDYPLLSSIFVKIEQEGYGTR